MTPELVLDLQAELGEGPIWDPDRRRLVFVDIMRGEVHAFDPSTGRSDAYTIGRSVGAVALTMRGDWLLASAHGFIRLDPDTGTTAIVAEVPEARPGMRMNDGACDPQGRFWAGTLSLAREREAAALYRLDPSGHVTRILSGITTSNGIDWDLDGRLAYYVDTGTRRIDVFDFDGERGTLSNRRPFVVVPATQGKPDGLVVDAEGGVWLALWGGSAIHRYGPDGRLDRVISLPVTQPTKCAFGGADLSDLYVTSAWRGLAGDMRAAQPHAGGLFRCRPGVRGKAAHRFAN